MTSTTVTWAAAQRVLPERLRERTRRQGTRDPSPAGELILYWMRAAVRAHENPALDVALLLGQGIGLPVLVYQALSERYPYASDRHHAFVLQGARDVQRELAARGIPYALHLEGPGDRGPHLRTLAARAALVVTEDVPVAPLAGWTARLAEQACVLAVDTACVVPMQLVGRAHDRAFAYRDATAALRAERVSRPWIEVAPAHPDHRFALPFTPVELATADLAALVAGAEIDHDVAPVAHTPGGSVAGYARFAAFVAQGLEAYAERRDDPLAGGVSRMSAYLHHGHVSPFRIARQAAAIGGAGAAKYLDELLIWRELAWAFAAFTPPAALDTVAAVPGWARASLAAHVADPRPALPSWETLARGVTGDPLWDAAQAQLRIHGELHNNVRMTWGKALLGWTRDAQAALTVLVDLNHRYALDGRDPASYGGILWCLGQFDRSFAPAQPITGAVRGRGTDHHARRLDVATYATRSRRPALPRPPHVAVVGAGLAGLVCARTLLDHGLTVTVLDKGRAPGGRISTRRTVPGDGFDHGAQFFTARQSWLQRLVHSWAHDGVVARWSPRVHGGRAAPTPWWVGTPDMVALAGHLARDLPVHSATQVTKLTATSGGWTLDVEGGEPHQADLVVLALPAPQCRALLPGRSPLAVLPDAVVPTPCWAVMVELAGAPDLGADVFVDDAGPIAWAARELSKPGRRAKGPHERWTLHASPAWSQAHLEDPPEAVAGQLGELFGHGRGLASSAIVRATAHRWRYARGAAPPGGPAAHLDPAARLAVCGDWLVASRIEDALRSGRAVAGLVLEPPGA